MSSTAGEQQQVEGTAKASVNRQNEHPVTTHKLITATTGIAAVDLPSRRCTPPAALTPPRPVRMSQHCRQQLAGVVQNAAPFSKGRHGDQKAPSCEKSYPCVVANTNKPQQQSADRRDWHRSTNHLTVRITTQRPNIQDNFNWKVAHRVFRIGQRNEALRKLRPPPAPMPRCRRAARLSPGHHLAHSSGKFHVNKRGTATKRLMEDQYETTSCIDVYSPNHSLADSPSTNIAPPTHPPWFLMAFSNSDKKRAW